MKIRIGFVSNSSSSSYIVIHKPIKIDEDIISEYKNKAFMIPEDLNHPQYQFGWENEEYHTFESKLCFALIQARYLDDPDNTNSVLSSDQIIEEKHPHFKMIYDALKEVLDTPRVFFSLLQKKPNGEEIFNYYIDHQSAAYEGMNKEMFISKEDMISFLFDDKSEITTGNDNGGDY